MFYRAIVALLQSKHYPQNTRNFVMPVIFFDNSVCQSEARKNYLLHEMVTFSELSGSNSSTGDTFEETEQLSIILNSVKPYSTSTTTLGDIT